MTAENVFLMSLELPGFPGSVMPDTKPANRSLTFCSILPHMAPTALPGSEEIICTNVLLPNWLVMSLTDLIESVSQVRAPVTEPHSFTNHGGSAAAPPPGSVPT